MLEASAATDRPAHLLTYAGQAYDLDAPYQVHRIPDFPRVRSLRSGPSWGKISLDVRCTTEIRRLAARHRPEAIVAHHIEAAIAALAARAAPVYYVAHTSLTCELPVYLPSLPPRLVSGLAAQVEATVCARAAGVAAVAPSLAHLLGEPARYLPVPWSLPAALGDIDPGTLERTTQALYQIGMGCQILDDMVDLASDLRMKRHNYVASLICHDSDPSEHTRLQEWLHELPAGVEGTELLLEFPRARQRAALTAQRNLEAGTRGLFMEEHLQLAQPVVELLVERIGADRFMFDAVK